VAQDDPHVSVGGLLDMHFAFNLQEFWIQFYKNPKYGGYVQQKNKEDNAREKCVVEAHLGE
jgi:hypothetical protein